MSANTVAAARTTAPAARLTTLRRLLALDAVVTGGNGLAYLALAGPLGDLLGAGTTTMVDLGAFLLVYGLAVGVLAARRQPPVLAVRAVIDANLVWPVLSLVAMELWLEPTTAGLVWIPLQAATVLGFAVLQFAALRKVRAAER
ncbi:hypothetical protein RMN57_12845 [Kitasatospora sp. CM 4170]|uniref:Integral membrane protein n=1 Tax=Kitasatospora aburaviensis TaxID=67265 RepID=A0ABW1F3N7_9ACTN|nr:hypothetical protein [Kitasatospora sp. CM 4170]WNM45544.1 hypothetical protein RMN57_12845 [Kitasatospora sp. CM 4170]